MYAFFVAFHNITRWLVLILGVWAIYRAVSGWFGQKEWQAADRKAGLFFTISIDIQLLLGFLLYFVYSEWGLKAIISKGMAFVMGQSEYRFFAVEHLTFMILAVVLAHVGNALTKKVTESHAKFKRAALWFGLTLVVILAGIPWYRPLIPGL